MKRRAFLCSTSALALIAVAPAGSAQEGPRIVSRVPFGPDTVSDMARALAAEKFMPRAALPDAWSELSYDDYRKVWFDPKNAVWRQSARRFEMDLLLPGLYFPRPVEVDVVADGMAERIAFDLDLFVNSEMLADLPAGDDLGFSGIRLRYVYEGEMWEREFAIFQGASYFRAIGAAQHYGLSARGLALRTGDADGEEFPEFTHLWVETPADPDETITVHALLDSASVTGAYRFRIAPGTACIMDVDCTIFPRVDLDHVGIAPLTSMFLYDETNRTRFPDFRPAIHDSDGLLAWNGSGEMLWRPLANPIALQVSTFLDAAPRGFGLMQRARRLSDFADLEAHYHQRPSLWIEPQGDWGEGAVRLVEIPSDKEVYDNIVAYWRPRDVLVAGSEHDFAYRMIWGDETVSAGAPPRPDVARVLNTYIGRDFDGDRILVAIDFAPQEALDRAAEGELGPPEWVPRDVSARVSSGQSDVSDPILQRNPETNGTRLSFTFDPGKEATVELRAQLLREGATVTEVWLYRWTRA